MSDIEPQIADTLMDDTMRALWSKLEKPWIRNVLRAHLPPTRVQWLNTAFIVHPQDNFTEFKMWEMGRPPEHEATAHFASELAGKPAVIVDVGANAGAFTLPILSAAGDGARLVLFEPNPVMRARLEANIAANAFGSAAQVFDCAISDAPGELPMHLPNNGNLGQARIGRDYANSDLPDILPVPVRVLPDCLAQAGVETIDLLKVDVEGLEDRVIIPLLQDDTAPKPAMIYFEIEHDDGWDQPLVKTLEDAGYVRVASFGKNALFARAEG